MVHNISVNIYIKNFQWWLPMAKEHISLHALKKNHIYILPFQRKISLNKKEIVSRQD